jgi:putative FmdB family regulatory protein
MASWRPGARLVQPVSAVLPHLRRSTTIHMPVYEYQCNSCHRDFEYQQRMSDPEKEICEACGGKLERVISRTAFALKGGGWYKDLYASNRPESSKSDGDGAGKAAGGDAPAAAAASTTAPASGTSAAASPAPAAPSSGSPSSSGSGSSST